MNVSIYLSTKSQHKQNVMTMGVRDFVTQDPRGFNVTPKLLKSLYNYIHTQAKSSLTRVLRWVVHVPSHFVWVTYVVTRRRILKCGRKAKVKRVVRLRLPNNGSAEALVKRHVLKAHPGWSLESVVVDPVRMRHLMFKGKDRCDRSIRRAVKLSAHKRLKLEQKIRNQETKVKRYVRIEAEENED